MVQILVNDIIPIIVIMALGYVCGKLSYFDDDQRQGLNKVVLNIALPAALFISIVKATREELAQDTTLTILGSTTCAASCSSTASRKRPCAR